MNTTRKVILKKVDEFSVSYEDGLATHKSNFPNAQVGQEWEIVESETSPDFPGVRFPLGVIVSTKLIKDVP